MIVGRWPESFDANLGFGGTRRIHLFMDYYANFI